MDPSNAGSISLGGSSNTAVARSRGAYSDRRNRSLPHPRGGPYPCPKCEDSYKTSQAFATHMRSHYKSEREERKRRRREARRGRPRANRRLAGSGPNGHNDPTCEGDEAEVDTLAGNAHMDVKAENVEGQEKVKENVQGNGSAQGN
ncbi:hypothetical protein ACJRO7_003768 [Eucalyptus globulus]|uniref:C2H2-type domain-containing protein n=1 Tax=Eucalyptus globulus TaxID=34317 RepID=A0ABD3IXC0_EUCGL